MTLKEMIQYYVEEKPKVLAKGERYLKQFGMFVRLDSTNDTIQIDFEVSDDKVKNAQIIIEVLNELKDRLIDLKGTVTYITNFDREIRSHQPKDAILALEEVYDLIHSYKMQLGIYATQEITKVIHVE